jgi:hypothetical protein
VVLRAYLGDRRAGPRFQIAGQLWASVDLGSDAVLRNISDSGALIEAPVSPQLQSTRAACITFPGGPTLTVQIRRLTPMTELPGEERCLVGIEFVSLTSEERRLIETFVRTWK